ncbi:DUF4232 domain-containing protein [Streptomyces sp. V4-01]|uniref:DUF4232 domain-containing protein n=1 Tax=Actinacidiphila polyblastidii TaxID=3110430 RepID=A0ABU7P474_9ACTN|nr:DUF4232 domain-containing protein [Streptomyces sp. V4-01]
MRRSSLVTGAAAGAAAAAVAVLTAVPATALPAVRDAPTAATTPMCATSQLTARLGGGDAGAGNLYRYLVLTNHSAATCHLTGFPGVSLLSGSGAQIGPAATRTREAYAPVVLKPGASASDTIHTANHMGTCLPTSAKVRVYPPGNTASLVIAGAIANCHDLLEITPLAAGSGGNPEGPVGSAPTPSAAPTAAPTGSGQQVTAVPSGAPDTGLVADSGSGSSNGPVAGATAAGVLALGGAAVALGLRRRSRTRVQG